MAILPDPLRDEIKSIREFDKERVIPYYEIRQQEIMKEDIKLRYEFLEKRISLLEDKIKQPTETKQPEQSQ